MDTLVISNSNNDTITDYSALDDSIQLSKAEFTQLGAIGALFAVEFVSGAGVAAAANLTQRIIYNTTDGVLRYDADGSGAGAAVIIGTFTNIPSLVVGEFTIIA